MSKKKNNTGRKPSMGVNLVIVLASKGKANSKKKNSNKGNKKTKA